jgi:hypothetical protein
MNVVPLASTKMPVIAPLISRGVGSGSKLAPL